MPAPGPRRPGRHRDRRAARPALRASIVALAVALVAAGCSSGGDDDTASTSPLESTIGDRVEVTAAELGPFAVDPGLVAGPGTPLGGGLSVPPGAVLLGVAFPDLRGGGFRAALLVTGSPVEVFNAVGDQARGLGMERADGSCAGDAVATTCRARFVDGSDGEALTVDLLRRVDDRGVVSGLGLRYRPPGSSDEDPPGGQSTPTQPLADVLLPAETIPGPDPADVGALLRAGDAPARSVERGSAIIGLPGPCGCDRPGWGFVAEITGVVHDVVAAYARQFSDLGEAPDISEHRRGDVTLLGVRVGDEDGAHAEVRAVVPDDGAAYLAVSIVGA